MTGTEPRLTDVGVIYNTISRIDELSNNIGSKAHELNATDSSEEVSKQESEAVGQIIISRLQDIERTLIRALECLNKFN